MTPTTSPEAEKMIEVFSDFLNAHAADNREEYIVKRSDYDEYDDPPKVLLDHIYAGDSIRVISLYAHPFHDEGGPNFLTGFFRNWGPDDSWDLDELLQYFDTDYTVILHNGLRSDAWPESMRQNAGQ